MGGAYHFSLPWRSVLLLRCEREQVLRTVRKPVEMLAEVAVEVGNRIVREMHLLRPRAVPRTADVAHHGVAEFHRRAFFPSPSLQSSQ